MKKLKEVIDDCKIEKDPALEYPDPTPIHIPGKDHPAPLSLREEMQRFVRQEVSRAAEAAEVETFEEADDFEIQEDPDLTSEYTVLNLQPAEGFSEESLDGEPTEEDQKQVKNETSFTLDKGVEDAPSGGEEKSNSNPT